MKSKYLELAEEQFFNLKEETLDLDRKSLGAEDTINYYDENDKKFSIKVNGYWEKATWFDYWVYDEFNNLLEKDIYII